MARTDDQTVLDSRYYLNRRFDDFWRKSIMVDSQIVCGKRWEDMIRKSMGYLLIAAVAILITLIFVLSLSYAHHSIFPPITYGPQTGEFRPPVVAAGESTLLCRDLTFANDVDYSISRQLVSKPERGEPQIVIDLGSIKTSRQRGFVRQCRLQQIPANTPPGTWVFQAQVTYKTWPFWEFTTRVPPLEIVVI